MKAEGQRGDVIIFNLLNLKQKQTCLKKILQHVLISCSCTLYCNKYLLGSAGGDANQQNSHSSFVYSLLYTDFDLRKFKPFDELFHLQAA